MAQHHGTFEDGADKAVRGLTKRYSDYTSALNHVLELADAAIPALIHALDHKQANPAAKALGLLMDRPAAAQAIPALLDWVIVQAPIQPDVRDALVRAGGKVVPELLKRLRVSADEGDDEAVRQLLDVAVRLPEEQVDSIVPAIVELLRHRNPNVREAAADAIWKLGLPHGASAVGNLRELSATDPERTVREAAEEALGRLAPSPATVVDPTAQGLPAH